MSEVRYATFDPETFVAREGLLDDADVIVRNPRFGHFTYPGTSTTTTALIVDLEDGEAKLHNQPYSVGQPDKFSPSDDGAKVLLTGTATSIDPKSNFALFVKSIINSGVPAKFFQTDDIKGIEGLRIHVKAQVQKDRDGNAIKNTKGYDRTVLLATKLIALPGQAPAAGAPAAGAKVSAPAGAKAPKAPAAPAAAAEVSDELRDKVIRYVAQVADAQGGTVLRSKVSTLSYQAAMKANDADKQAVMKLSFDESFLTDNTGRMVEADGKSYAFEYDAAAKSINRIAA